MDSPIQTILNAAYHSNDPLFYQVIEFYTAQFKDPDWLLDQHRWKLNQLTSSNLPILPIHGQRTRVLRTLYNLLWSLNCLSIRNQTDIQYRYDSSFHVEVLKDDDFYMSVLNGVLCSVDLHYLPTTTQFIQPDHLIDMSDNGSTQKSHSTTLYEQHLKQLLTQQKLIQDNEDDFLEKIQNRYIYPLNRNKGHWKHTSIPGYELPSLQLPSLPLLFQGQLGRVILSRYQVSFVIACLMTQQKDGRHGHLLFPSLNFSRLYDHCMNNKNGPAEYQKFLCIYQGYMKRWIDGEFDMDDVNNEYIVYSRHHSQTAIDSDALKSILLPMGQVVVTEKTEIEQDKDAIQVDFANKFIGGGVLTGGYVQEEIRFAIEPECIAAMVFFQAMGDMECITITGTKPYSTYSGYGQHFQYHGPIQNIKDKPVSHITCIDATDYRHISTSIQLGPFPRALRAHQCGDDFLRDLNKAYIGFQPAHYSHLGPTCILSEDLLYPLPLEVPHPKNAHESSLRESIIRPVATGHWGCGAFLGNVDVKAIQQWMAATMAGRVLHYHVWDVITTTDSLNKTAYPSSPSNAFEFVQRFENVIGYVSKNKLTISDLYGYIKLYSMYLIKNLNQDMTLFQYILTHDKNGQPVLFD